MRPAAFLHSAPHRPPSPRAVVALPVTHFNRPGTSGVVAAQASTRRWASSDAAGADNEGGPSVKAALSEVTARVEAAALARSSSSSSGKAEDEAVQLVVVSKTKPIELLQEAYAAGARQFGENYIQELIEKAPALPEDIRWHFIGHLQSNKAKKLVEEVPNLAVVETVDSFKLAAKLNAAVEKAGDEAWPADKTLGIYLQVNTSGEESKSGVSPGDVADLAVQVSQTCPRLSVAGVMTIGAPGDASCFDRLVACRAAVADALAVPPPRLALSMGMSGDFEEAIARGATSVRVGSSILGVRAYTGSKAL